MRGIFRGDEIDVSLEFFQRKKSNENEKKRMRYRGHVYVPKENGSNKMKMFNKTSNQFSIVT